MVISTAQGTIAAGSDQAGQGNVMRIKAFTSEAWHPVSNAPISFWWAQVGRWLGRHSATLGTAGIFVVSAGIPGCGPGNRDHKPTPEGSPAESPETPATSAGHAPAEPAVEPAVDWTPGPAPTDPPAIESDAQREYRIRPQRMVDQQLRRRDITDPRVLGAMDDVPRHLFVPLAQRGDAYSDFPLPIGHRQTISQPYIVALMTQLAHPKPDAHGLDVGTGSGYQAAVLATLIRRVESIEIVPALAEESRKRLKTLGFNNVNVRCGDGYRGWPERAPFDLIIVAAAPGHVPQPLIDQLAPGGRLVIPVGNLFQKLVVVEKHKDGQIEQRTVAPVSFVPMTGEAQRGE
jgi:protein-L-isoaspartate(D-aspartate) O-methyltransferase